MGLKSTLEALNDAVDDLASLHVQTYTGTINWKEAWKEDAGAGDNKTLRSLRTFEGFSDQAASAANVNLVADSLMKFDGDSYNFIASNTTSTESALQLHKNAVESGINARAALMELVRGIFT